MVRVVKNIGAHILEVDISAWTCMATIKLDGRELLYKFVTGGMEVVSVDNKEFIIKFSGLIFPKITIQEAGYSHTTAAKGSEELSLLKTQKSRVSGMLLKLDEKFINKEISEQNYNELKAKYESKLKDVEKQIVEVELHV